MRHGVHVFVLLLSTILVISCGRDDDNQMRAAQQAFEQGHYRLSIIRLKNHLLSNPGDTDARVLLGRAYLRTGQPGWAEKEFRAAIRQGNALPEVKLMLARSLGSQRKYQELLDLLENFHTGVPDQDFEAYLLRAKALRASKRYEEAVEQFRKALSIREDAEALTGLARTYLESRKIRRAREILDQLEHSGEDSIDYLVLKARYLQKSGQIGEAIRVYSGLLPRIDGQADSAAFRIYTGLISAYMERKQYARAREILDRMRKVFRKHLLVNYIDTLLSFYERNYEEALEKGLKLYSKIPDNRSVLALLGYSNYVLGNYEQANMYVTHLLARDPENIDILRLLARIRKQLDEHDGDEITHASKIVGTTVPPEEQGAVLARLSLSVGKYGDAARYLEQAIHDSKNKDRRMAYETDLAGVYLLSGDPTKAIEILDHEGGEVQKELSLQREMIYIAAYLELNDEARAMQRIQALEKRGADRSVVDQLRLYVYMRANRIDDAIRLLEAMIERDPEDQRALRMLVGLYVRHGSPDKAVSLLEQRLHKQPGDSGTALLLAALHVRAHELHKAAAVLDHLIQTTPNELVPRIARAELYLAQGDVEHAREVLETLPEEAERTPAYAIALAKVYLKAKDREGARQILSNLPDWQKSRPDVALFLASLLSEEDKQEQAAITLLQSLQQSRDLRLLPYLADVLTSLDPKTVSDLLDRFGKEEASFVPLLQRVRAAYHLRRSEPAKARRILRSLVVQQDAPDLLYQYARASLLAGNPPEPELVDEKAGERVSLLVRLAELYARHGLKKRALALYRRAIGARADNVAALNNASYLCLELGESCGLDYAASAYALQPEDPDVIDTYAWALFLEKKDVSRARRLLEKALGARSDNPWIQYHYARVLSALGETAQSQTIFERLLKEPALDDVLRREVTQHLDQFKKAG